MKECTHHGDRESLSFIGGRTLNKGGVVSGIYRDIAESEEDPYRFIAEGVGRELWAALSGHAIEDMWRYIRSCPIFLESRVKPGKNFWPNFSLYLHVLFYNLSEIWADEVERRVGEGDCGYASPEGRFEMMAKMRVECEFLENTEGRYPDFPLYGYIIVKFLRAIEDKFQDVFKREIAQEEFSRSVEVSDLYDQLWQLMINHRAAGYPFIEDMLLGGKMDDPKSYFRIDDIEMDPQTLAVRINCGWVRACKKHLIKNPIESPNTQVNCPLIYTELFPEIFAWTMAIANHYRFGVSLPPDIECLDGSEEDFVRVNSQAVAERLGEIYQK